MASADTLNEDFESYNPSLNPDVSPDQDWYDYREGEDIGSISTTRPIQGTQSLRIRGNATTDSSTRYVDFTLEAPAQLNSTTFYVNGTSLLSDGLGSRQVVTVESSAPARTMVQFYIFCNDPVNTTSCEFRVRFDNVDSVGQVLINGSLNQTLFKVQIVPDWLNGNYRLYVNDVDDGVFPFLEIPQDIGRLRILQYRADIPVGLTFDNWTVVGTTNGTASLESDAAGGLKGFAEDIRFTSSGSLFFFGLLLFFILSAAVIVPLLSIGLDNTVVPATGFFVCLVALWLVYMEFWPSDIGITMIIACSALAALTVRRLFMGIRNASTGGSLVAGSLGYFIIASSLLAFSGYATDAITIPTSPADQSTVNETSNPDQTFVGAVLECVYTGGAFTFGLVGDCSQQTVTQSWQQITDILGWIRNAFDFLFQLLTFQLPIPVIFNVIIVLPPAAALATYAISVIRGVAT